MTNIIHKAVWKSHKQDTNNRGVVKVRVPYYRCNQAVTANPNKIAINGEKVTCKNCLRFKDES